MPAAAVAAAAGVLLLLGAAATRQGAAVTPDSVQYLSAAEHVAAGRGVWTSVTNLDVLQEEIPFAAWPPLYPAILGGLSRVGIPMFPAARWWNVLLAAAAVLPLAWLAALVGGRDAVAPVVVLHALMFYPVFVASFVWSESTYVFLSLLSLALAARALGKERGFPWEYALAGAAAGAAMLTRYTGFTLIGATLLAVWLLSLSKRPALLLRDLVLYGAPAVLPNLAWLARNHHLTGFFFGEKRPEAWFGWDRILSDAGRTLGLDWTAPVARAATPWAGALAAAGILGGVLLLAVALPRLRHLRFPAYRPETGAALLLGFYATAFLLGMILLSHRVGFDPLNTRYLCPAYPVLLVLMVAGYRAVLRADRRRKADYRVRNLVGTGLVLLAAAQLGASAVLLSEAGRERRTVTRPYWTSTLWDDAAWDRDPGLQRLPVLAGPGGLVISNLWDFVGIRTGLPAKPLPEPSWEGFPRRVLDFPGALIAVHRRFRRYRATAEDLHAVAGRTGRLAFLERTGDWDFFRVIPGKGAGPASRRRETTGPSAGRAP